MCLVSRFTLCHVFPVKFGAVLCVLEIRGHRAQAVLGSLAEMRE
jgi:hypothetical protein